MLAVDVAGVTAVTDALTALVSSRWLRTMQWHFRIPDL